MKNNTLRRLAIGASAITVIGVGVPFISATAASAAEATGITATPSTQTVKAGSTADYKVSLTGTSPTASGVYYAITAGPSNVALAGTACNDAASTPKNTGTGPFTCAVNTSSPALAAGSYTLTIFDDVAGTHTFQNSDPSKTVSLNVAGAATLVSITPTTNKASTAVCASYTVSAKDANGNAAAGQTVDLAIAQTVPTANGDPDLTFCDPTTTAFPATASGDTAGTAVGANTPYSNTETVTLGDGTGSSTAGSLVIGVASDAPGTVNIMAGHNTGTTNGQAATLTVSQGNTSNTASSANNDNAATITLTPGNTSAYAGQSVTETATVKNGAGDPIGGVSVDYVINNSTTSFTPCTAESGQTNDVTNQAGQILCAYTPAAAGAYALTAYSNTDKNSPNTSFPDANDPKSTPATITATTEPSFNGFTGSCAGVTSGCTVPASQATEVVTFTLTDTGGPGGATERSVGQTVNFTTTSTDAGVSISPSSSTTNAQGQVSVTVTHTAGSTNTVPVKATLAGDSNETATVTVIFQPSSASSGTISLAPQNQTKAVGSTVTVTATAADQFGAGVSGDVVNFTVLGARNSSTTNSGATGSCTTAASGSCNFTYTDNGAALTGSSTAYDQVHAVDATTGKGTTSDATHASGAPGAATAGSDATVTFVSGTATAAKVAVSANSSTANTAPAGTAPASGNYVTATVTDGTTAGNPVANDAVTFTSTGAGTFVSSSGASLGTSTTVQTDGSGVAKVFVSSTTPGVQSVSASADGVNSFPPATITYSNGQYNPVTPQRLVDTRSGQGAVNTGPLAPNTNYTFDLAKAGYSVIDAKAYVFNVTAIAPSGAGNLRIGPDDGKTPSTSLINYVKGQTSANAVVVPNTGTTAGQFTLYSDGGSANVTIDITGYYPSTSTSFGAVDSTIPAPVRVADTRSDNGGTIAAGTTRVIQVADANLANKAIALNVTAIAPSGRGYLQVYPDGSPQPTTSNINYVPGQSKAAFVVVKLPANGKIDVYSGGASVNVAIDKFANYATAATVVTQNPSRVYDTRGGAGELQNNVPRTIPVTGGTTGVPTGAQAVLVSVTAIPAKDSTGVGNLRVYPAGTALPTVSTLNYNGSYPVANFAIVPVSSDGKITLDSNGSNVDVAVDILGYYPAAS